MCALFDDVDAVGLEGFGIEATDSGIYVDVGVARDVVLHADFLSALVEDRAVTRRLR
jgi:hypothetical protein